MWIDGDGVAHTVALPDPSRVMTDEFRLSLDLLASSERDAVDVIILAAEERIFEMDLGPMAQPEYEAVPAPVDLMRGSLTTTGDLNRAIEETDLRWRLDAVLALGDYLDITDIEDG